MIFEQCCILTLQKPNNFRLNLSFQCLGFEVIDDYVPHLVKKLGYGSIWFSCAFAFFLFQRLNQFTISVLNIFASDHLNIDPLNIVESIDILILDPLDFGNKYH